MSEYAISRNSPRKDLHKTLGMHLWRANEGAVVLHARALGHDISSGGVGISTEFSLHPGEVVRLDYPLNGDEVTIPVYSEVIWCAEENGDCRAGLRFLS